MPRRVDLTGQRFGRLVVSAEHESRPYGGKSRVFWRCLCDCGTERWLNGDALRTGNTKSCGCYNLDALAQRATTHGMSGTVEYDAWTNMKSRCYYPGNDYYHRYGGRGIKVCQRWLESFEAFFADMGPRPSPAHSIERIDNDGDYEPGNVRWATPAEQSGNRSANRIVTYNGRQMIVTEAARAAGVDRRVVYGRIQMGWPQRDWFLPANTPRPRLIPA